MATRKYSVHEAEIMMRDRMDEMRKEYTRMRDIAQKRIQRMGKSAFANTATYREHSSGFKKLKDLPIRDLPKAFSELSKFVSAKGSTVSGQKAIKQKTINTWQKQGLPVDNQNYDMVIKVLEESRKQKLVYGSDKMVELADLMLERDDINNPRIRDLWLDNLSTLLPHLDELQEIPDLNGYDFDEIMELLEE